MERQTFSTTINASRERVWEILWGNYSAWNAHSSERLRLESDFKRGSKLKYISNTNNGVVATIEEIIPNEYISLRDLGDIKDGEEIVYIMRTDDIDLQNFKLTTVDGATLLEVDMVNVTNPSIQAKLKQYWDTALQNVKNLSEKE
ncbi:SRPBCC family protein [Flavobacterium sp. '19STA2R22 D10 B1']|uniref:SRPBCC family protein n=1 Tax=Flavobacterium aerium TaxID=3037261 RepID=UPI00278C3A29|nr:SRPBCC domain-containing protein [Flavobacterium sp. '19STA2R22 D10 B1']